MVSLLGKMSDVKWILEYLNFGQTIGSQTPAGAVLLPSPEEHGWRIGTGPF